MKMKNYELVDRYGGMETMPTDRAITIFDNLVEELKNEEFGKPDLAHTQVSIIDEDEDSLTIFIDGSICVEQVVGEEIKVSYRAIDTIANLRMIWTDFILNKRQLLQSNKWQQSISELQLSQPSIFKAHRSTHLCELHEAAYQGDLRKVQSLLAQGVDINFQDEDGATPVMHATVEGHLEIVKLLIEKGAALDLKDNEGDDIYDLAESHDDIVRYLNENV